MRTGSGLWWLLAFALAAPAMAQTPPPAEAPAAETEAGDAEEAAPAGDEETLPDIDIWSEDADQEEDVFIPTERISADSSIAYPVDI